MSPDGPLLDTEKKQLMHSPGATVPRGNEIMLTGHGDSLDVISAELDLVLHVRSTHIRHTFGKLNPDLECRHTSLKPDGILVMGIMHRYIVRRGSHNSSCPWSSPITYREWCGSVKRTSQQWFSPLHHHLRVRSRNATEGQHNVIVESVRHLHITL